MSKQLFVTGISTEVGKTVVAAILTQALRADYWKPIQSGDLEASDSHTIRELVSFEVNIHNNSYALTQPMSPHAAAEIDGITIQKDNILPPNTQNHLVIEGAGGVLVPINDQDTIADIILPQYQIILVSKQYLGSINHTLLTINELYRRGLSIAGIIYNGQRNIASEEIIEKHTQIPVIGYLEEGLTIDKELIKQKATLWQKSVEQL